VRFPSLSLSLLLFFPPRLVDRLCARARKSLYEGLDSVPSGTNERPEMLIDITATRVIALAADTRAKSISRFCARFPRKYARTRDNGVNARRCRD